MEYIKHEAPNINKASIWKRIKSRFEQSNKRYLTEVALFDDLFQCHEKEVMELAKEFRNSKAFKHFDSHFIVQLMEDPFHLRHVNDVWDEIDHTDWSYVTPEMDRQVRLSFCEFAINKLRK